MSMNLHGIKQYVRGAIKVCFFVIFFLFIMSETVKADDIIEQNISINTTFTGTQKSGQEYKFNFRLPKPGFVTVQYSAMLDINEGNYFYDLGGRGSSSSWDTVTGKVEFSTYGYYSAGDSFFSFNNTGNGDFSVKITYIESQETFPEVPDGCNNTLQNAQPIKTNNVYYGVITDNDHVDVYSFDVTSGKYFIIVDNVRQNIDFPSKIYVYNEEGIEKTKLDYGWVQTALLDFEATESGKYYIAISDGNTNLAYSLRIQSFCDANGHGWNNGIITKEPTCKEAGIKTYTCKYCDEKKTETVKATGHQFGNWFVSVEATTSAPGEEVRVCSICGEKETRTIPRLSTESDSSTNEDVPSPIVQENETVSPSNGKSNPSANIKVTALSLKSPSTKIAAGKKVQLHVSVSPADAANKSVTWISSNPKVAKVSSSGKVSFLKKTGGKKVTITATANDGSGKKATITLKSMKGVVKKIKIKGKKKVKAGKTLKLKAKVKASKGANKKLEWISSNPEYATVKNGKVKSLKAGKGKRVKITVRALDGSNKKASIKIKIK